MLKTWFLVLLSDDETFQTFGLMIKEVGHWLHAFEGDIVIFDFPVSFTVFLWPMKWPCSLVECFYLYFLSHHMQWSQTATDCTCWPISLSKNLPVVIDNRKYLLFTVSQVPSLHSDRELGNSIESLSVDARETCRRCFQCRPKWLHYLCCNSICAKIHVRLQLPIKDTKTLKYH